MASLISLAVPAYRRKLASLTDTLTEAVKVQSAVVTQMAWSTLASKQV